MAGVASPFPPGTRIDGRFVVAGVLGSGGMGMVLRAQDLEVGREVALKVALGALDGARLERFRREATLTAGLSHPGIVRVHSSGLAGARPWIAFELVEGARPLDEAWRELDAPRRVALVRDAARALGHAHARGVVHRDVKAENLLVDARGALRVADFGLATATDLERLTHSGAIVGTPWAMAPEQFEPGEDVGPEADVWALGVVLFEALTGSRPFEGATLLEVGAQVLGRDPELPGAPPSLAAVCLRALERSPADRYPDGEALALDLDRALRGEGVTHRRRRLPRRASLALLPAAALVLVAGLAVAYHPAVRPWRAAPGPVAAPGPASSPVAPSPSPPTAAPVASREASRSLGSADALSVDPASIKTAAPPAPDGLTTLGQLVWQGAHDGIPEAMVQLGSRYRDGPDLPRDLGQALLWFERAAAAGHATGACKAGELLWAGVPGRPPDPARAVALMRQAAAAGNGFAMRWLARRLLEGVPPHLPRDPVEAYALFLRHARGGDADSMVSAARLLKGGIGVEQDEVAAARWLEQALRDPTGDARVEASFLLALLLQSGRGAARDEARAASLFQVAADEEHGPSCLALGQLYRAGRGVPRDLQRAEQLFVVARQAKVKGAARALNALRAEMRAGTEAPPPAAEPDAVEGEE